MKKLSCSLSSASGVGVEACAELFPIVSRTFVTSNAAKMVLIFFRGVGQEIVDLGPIPDPSRPRGGLEGPGRLDLRRC